MCVYSLCSSGNPPLGVRDELSRVFTSYKIMKDMEDNLKRTLLSFGLLITLAIPSGLRAQQAGYSQTNLVSNTAGVATTTDSQLLNPWGISFIPGMDFWIADNNSGTSTLYDNMGKKDAALVVTIPGATKNPNGNCSPGCPTGTVANGNGIYFGGGQFIFDTEDGLIASWTGASNTASLPSITPPAARFTKVSPWSTAPFYWQQTSTAAKLMCLIVTST